LSRKRVYLEVLHCALSCSFHSLVLFLKDSETLRQGEARDNVLLRQPQGGEKTIVRIDKEEIKIVELLKKSNFRLSYFFLPLPSGIK
jgi:hypothetical protein